MYVRRSDLKISLTIYALIVAHPLKRGGNRVIYTNGSLVAKQDSYNASSDHVITLQACISNNGMLPPPHGEST